MTQSITLPVPDDFAQQCSKQLFEAIKQAILASEHGITFADYMQQCLYYPGLGYYSAGSYKLGQGGDFTTAPEVSPLFSQALSHHFVDVLAQCEQPSILEFGAGSGKMAVAILLELQRLNRLPENYFIIEASADLQQRQQETIREQLPDLSYMVKWLTEIPADFEGVVVANEVCDAMPVHLLRFDTDSVSERGVTLHNEKLHWCDLPLKTNALIERANQIKPLIQSQDYTTEVNLAAEAWLKTVADKLRRGAIFIIDYGHPRHEYYHPQRSTGSLMCYYQHKAHDNPFHYPGLQDITAHVDFTALAEVAIEAGLSVSGFQAQADFLLAGDISDLASDQMSKDPLKAAQQTTALKRLLLPQYMGESFKVLSLTRKLAMLPRTQFNDRRRYL